MRERKCQACRYVWGLWSEILYGTADHTNCDDRKACRRSPDRCKRDTVYGDLAFRGLRLERNVTDFHVSVALLDGFDWDLVQTVHSARLEYESFVSWKQNKAAEELGK
jgi:hypothetical protein